MIAICFLAQTFFARPLSELGLVNYQNILSCPLELHWLHCLPLSFSPSPSPSLHSVFSSFLSVLSNLLLPSHPDALYLSIWLRARLRRSENRASHHLLFALGRLPQLWHLQSTQHYSTCLLLPLLLPTLSFSFYSALKFPPCTLLVILFDTHLTRVFFFFL